MPISMISAAKTIKPVELLIGGKPLVTMGAVITVAASGANAAANYKKGTIIYSTTTIGPFEVLAAASLPLTVGGIAYVLAEDFVESNATAPAAGSYKVSAYAEGEFNKQTVINANPILDANQVTALVDSLEIRGIHLVAVAGQTVRTL